MKRKNGFTLIELLAVIVILAIIALISTPIIIGVIEKARKGAFEDSAYGVLDAAKLYFTEKLADTNGFDYTEFNFNGDMKDLKIGGEKPYGGSLLIDDDGKQALAIYDKDKKWCATKTFEEEKIRIIDNYKKCDKDIAENLIINGYGEYGNNTNFSKFTYVEGENAFSYTSNTILTIMSDALIPIDENNKYELSVEAKSNNPSAIFYGGMKEYDKNENMVNTNNVEYIENSLTELTQDLKNGDTVVYLKDISAWLQQPVYIAQPYLTKGFTFWNYQDENGYLYPPETFSKNVYFSLYEFSSINKVNHTITLNEPWNKGNISAGTKVSQSHSGNEFNYGLIQSQSIPSTYQKYTNRITGYGGRSSIFDKFKYTTKFVNFASIFNYNSQSNTTLTIKNIVLKKV